ncbi:hypothetical protein [Enterococcus sp. DIV0660C]|uniref:hypothetical protein n=1 Tax=Enterococcus sp. DIV0660C TaxID=2230880 RepID=UPI001A8E558C|nr:hypothetical protein [Enterococcus sp. DIV0660C]MBO0430787.1 hypothetical protein [Enterococcus sp. DIV0660C]
MNLFDFWSLTFGGTTRDSYEKKNGQLNLLPSFFWILFVVAGMLFLHFLIGYFWK